MKWLVFIAAALVAAVAFLSWRKRAQAAMRGLANTTSAPAGATGGGTLAALTAPARRSAPVSTPVIPDVVIAPAQTAASYGSIGGSSLSGILKRAVTLAAVGTGTVVPSKPATQPQPLPAPGQSYYTASRAPAPAPPPPAIKKPVVQLTAFGMAVRR